MTHSEWSAQAKVATPCTAHSLTFGGRCLNCGYEPEREGFPNPSRVTVSGPHFVTGLQP